jgi:hypothetical protein
MQLTAVPEWTQVPQRSGNDPLGMAAPSVRLYQDLVPGISNVTLRTRYYGLYAWLSADYARRTHSADPDLWRRTVRRSEALYALAAAKADPDVNNGVAGIRWAVRKLENRGRATTIDFSAEAEHDHPKRYLRQPWGAYGAAYESQLIETGILGDAEGHAIRVPTEVLGDEMSKAFAQAAGDAGPRFARIVEAGEVSVRALDELARMLPSAIHPQSRERADYERILFADFPDRTERDLNRRKTLVLALRIARRLKRPPTPIDVRWILYAGHDWSGRPLTLRELELVEHRRRWWAYQAGDLGRIAYLGLLKWLLDVLETHPAGIPLDALVRAAVDAIAPAKAGWPATWRELTAGLPEAANALSPRERTAEFRLAAEVLKAGREAARAPRASARAAVELLAVLARRCVAERKFLAEQHGGDHPDAIGRSLANELTFLEWRADLPLPELLARVLKERIVHRHLWVAMHKMQAQRDYTFLIETDDGRVRLRAKDGPVATNPRLRPTLTFLRDIHLVDAQGLTKRGRELAEAA